MKMILLLVGGVLAFNLASLPARADAEPTAYEKALYDRARYQVLSKVGDDDFGAYCVTMHIGGDTLLKFHDDLLGKRTELAALIAQGLGPEHPQVAALDAEIKDLNAQYLVKLGEARKALELESHIAEATLSALGQASL